MALDRIAIGFNGKTRAKTSDRTANPLLQDVNKGWLQAYRDQAAQRVMDHGATAGKVKVGAAGDYANLDALVYDWSNSHDRAVAPRRHGARRDVRSRLLHDKYFPLINKTGSRAKCSRLT
jgi:hypothetical protein